MPSLTGTCLCKAVTLTVKDTGPVFAEGTEVCQCTDCRQFTGCCRGAEFLEAAVANVSIEGGEVKSYEKTSDAGNSYARHFCSTCGSSLYDMAGCYGGKKVAVHAGE